LADRHLSVLEFGRPALLALSPIPRNASQWESRPVGVGTTVLVFKLGLAVLLYLAFKVGAREPTFGEGESDQDPDWADNASLAS
jgi:hypothetical protein